MKRILLVIGIVVIFYRIGYCDDNLSVLGSYGNKNKEKEKIETKTESVPERVITETANKEKQDRNQEVEMELVEDLDDTDKRVEDMKAYHDILDSKQKEIDIIKLDLEKQRLLLEKKEAQKKIQDIVSGASAGERIEDAAVFMTRKTETTAFFPEEDIKILLLVVTDNLKEAMVAVNGRQNTVYEGVKIDNNLTVESIKNTGIVFKRENGETFVRNFNQ